MSMSMSPLGARKYGAILVDPPWHFKTWSARGTGRSAISHYHCLDLEDLKSLPVIDLAVDDCALFLWATDPILPLALKLINAWGFTYKTVAFTWVKTTKDGTGYPIGRLLDARKPRAVPPCQDHW